MRRNLNDYAIAGEKKISPRYELVTSELEQLREMALRSSEGMFEALTKAYYCGFEAGYRQRTNEGKA